jgi:hypothetical protein
MYAVRGQPSDNVRDFLGRHFLGRHGRARSVISPVRHASVGAAGDHRYPDGLIAHKREERRIDNRPGDPMFAMACRAISLKDHLAARWVAQARAICGQSNSNKISRS